jgi:hypothetical protein
MVARLSLAACAAISAASYVGSIRLKASRAGEGRTPLSVTTGKCGPTSPVCVCDSMGGRAINARSAPILGSPWRRRCSS